jgi:Leu/Phe-tRNA-protein transferase
MIQLISPENLDEEFLRHRVYPDLSLTLFWSDRWEPAFYVALARAGFISISTIHPEHGPVLIPELQEGYGVLDWPQFHISRNLRRLMRSGRLEDEGIELRIADSCDRVLERLLEYHEAGSWLTEPYVELMLALPTNPGSTGEFALHGVELWSRERDQLIAGELGYTIGCTYTSLSGFCPKHEDRWRHFGTLQMLWLAQNLQRRGYAFWNMGHMGHPSLRYKHDLGAKCVPRGSFLTRWLRAIARPPVRALRD